MLEVDIEKILPVTEARDNFNKLVDDVESSDGLYVLTKNGKPCAVVVGVHHLEKLTGTSHQDLMSAAAGGISGALSDDPSTASTTTAAQDPAQTAEEAEVPATEPVAATETASTIDLTNFPDDDVQESDPAPISQSDEPAAPDSSSSNVISGITNIAADPTLSTSPFTSDASSPVIGQEKPPVKESSIDPATQAPEAPIEDPLDFLSNMDNTAQGTPAPAPAQNAAPLTSASQEPAPAAPVSAPSASAFSDISEGPNGSTTPDEIVAPTQGAYAQPPADTNGTEAQPQQPVQQ